MSKDFWWKSDPFGWQIPVCRNMWVPPGTPLDYTPIQKYYSPMQKHQKKWNMGFAKQTHEIIANTIFLSWEKWKEREKQARGSDRERQRCPEGSAENKV